MSILDELIQIMNEAEAELIDPNTDLSNTKLVKTDSGDNTSDDNTENSNSTEIAIFDNEGYQKEFTNAFKQCASFIINNLKKLKDLYTDNKDTLASGVLTQEQYKEYSDICTKVKEDLKSFSERTYPPLAEELTIMEQKWIEDGMNVIQVVVTQLYIIIESCVKPIEDKSTKTGTAIVVAQSTEVATTGDNSELNEQPKPDDKLLSKIKKVMDEIDKTMQDVINILKLSGQQLLDKLNELLHQALAKLGYASLMVVDKLEDIVAAIKNACSFVGEFVKNLFNGIKDMLAGTGEIAKELMALSPLTLFIRDNAAILKTLIKLPILTVALLPSALMKTIKNKKKEQTDKQTEKLNKQIKKVEQQIRKLEKKAEKQLKTDPDIQDLDSEIQSKLDLLKSNPSDELSKKTAEELKALRTQRNDLVKKYEPDLEPLQNKLEDLESQLEKVTNPKGLKDHLLDLYKSTKDNIAKASYSAETKANRLAKQQATRQKQINQANKKLKRDIASVIRKALK